MTVRFPARTREHLADLGCLWSCSQSEVLRRVLDERHAAEGARLVEEYRFDDAGEAWEAVKRRALARAVGEVAPASPAPSTSVPSATAPKGRSRRGRPEASRVP